jgi:hypothetical protein
MKIFGTRADQVENLVLLSKIFIEWLLVNDLVSLRIENLLRL